MSNARDKKPADQAVRDRALAPEASFIVQAPAGSGKTALLVQRFLTLLARADAPEEIVAITFTRKAAGEMRGRVLDALRLARSAGAMPDNEYEARTLALGRAALQRDVERGWNLLQNPGRLRVQTIDSLCLELARQMPVLSQFGALPATVEEARPLYLEAAVAVLAELDRGDRWADAVATLLQHLDNNQARMQELIADMLAHRDQWLRHLGDMESPRLERSSIEAALRGVVECALHSVAQRIPRDVGPELCELARFAASNLEEDSLLAPWRDRIGLPGSSVEELEPWLGSAELLLTKSGGWRSPDGIKVGNGFPPPGKGSNAEEKARFGEMKERMKVLLHELEGKEEFRRSLHALRALPRPAYSDEEWTVLEALFRVLLRAAMQLMVVFGQRGEMDFSEAALRANRALGHEDAPSDLALRLDYRIRHLLVDEFQDTSQNQFDLFRHLTAGWEPGDGRSLFLVGDPMQSIYRFREAEVGLFLRVWNEGLGNVRLEPLRLEVNFRSRAGVVEWVNEAFPQVLPGRSDQVHGAVSYAPFRAWHPPEAGEAVTAHPFIGADPEAEAERVVEIIRRARAENPAETVAVLVRARSHLPHIVEALDSARREGERELAYQAVEISPLASRQGVLDLFALTRALLHPADRIAWLALLHAPFCGLSLADLYRLAGENRDAVLPQRLREAAATGTLGDGGMLRLARVLPVLEAALANRGRRPLRQWVEGVWLALGGPACIDTPAGLNDAEAFLRLLEQQGDSTEEVSAATLAKKLERLYAQPDNHAAVQLMTMHKAKGLEFDTVIVPGLGRQPRAEGERLLYWLEQPSPAGPPELLFGPIRSAGEKKNPTAAYIRGLEKEKGDHETGRLLYVAATRARRRLHLLGRVAADNEGAPREPPARTLLRHLWPAVREQFIAAAGKSAAVVESAETAVVRRRPRLRLPAAWRCPWPPADVGVALPETARKGGAVEFDWAGDVARLSGAVVHRLLQHLAEGGVEIRSDVDRYAPAVRRMLLQAGITGPQLKAATGRIMAALNNVLADPRGRWILSGDHQEAECEAAVTTEVAGTVRRLVVDRTFVDADGLRWVIDYKTGAHEGGDIEAFLDREQTRYQEQLENYARAFAALEARPVRMGLYFPLLRGWREWSPAD